MGSLDSVFLNSVSKHFNSLESLDGDPPFAFNVGVRFGFGNSGFNYNFNASVGLQHSTPNLNLSSFITANIYGGSQLGTQNGSKKMQYDVSGGAYMTAGSGKGDAHNFYVLNYNSPSPFKNTFDLSVSFGQLITYNSAINERGDGPGIQTQGLFGLRLGNNFSLSYNNDATSAPTFAGIFRKSLGVLNTDAGWTGALSINAFGIEAGYQNFSGYRSMGFPGFGVGKKYPQTKYHQSLNKASSYIQYNGSRFEYFGDAWLQNLIHNYISKESTYEYAYRYFNWSKGF
jgi:hypothetical protein